MIEAIVATITIVVLMGTFAARLNKGSAPQKNTAGSMHQSIHQPAEEEQNDMQRQINPVDTDPIELMLNTLINIGCQPTLDEKGVIIVRYQGENFTIEKVGSMYCRIWDPWWLQISVNDQDVPAMKEAINAANLNFGSTVVFSPPNAHGVIGIHSRMDILFLSAIPHIEDYIQSVFDSFFAIKERVRIELNQIKDREERAPGNPGSEASQQQPDVDLASFN